MQLFQAYLKSLQACRPDPQLARVVEDKMLFQLRPFPRSWALPFLPTRKYPDWVEGAGCSPVEQLIHQFQLCALMLPFIDEGN